MQSYELNGGHFPSLSVEGKYFHFQGENDWLRYEAIIIHRGSENIIPPHLRKKCHSLWNMVSSSYLFHGNEKPQREIHIV